MKYKAKQMKNGKWAVFTGKQYFTDTVTENKHDATVRALEMSGCWYRDQIDKVDDALRKLGAFDENDGHGYMA